MSPDPVPAAEMHVPETPATEAPAPARAETPAPPTPAADARFGPDGDVTPAPGNVPPEAFDLADRIRDLAEAAVTTEVGPAELAAATKAVVAATEILHAAQRPKERVARLLLHDNGRYEHLTQAGSGRLNPQAPRTEFLPPIGLTPGGTDEPFEIHARVTLTAQHAGPSGRAHGGVVATVLDQMLGMAVSVNGPAGFTAGLDIRFRGPTPCDTPLDVSARTIRQEGRKTFATGEIRADGVVAAEATAVFVAARDSSADGADRSR